MFGASCDKGHISVVVCQCSGSLHPRILQQREYFYLILHQQKRDAELERYQYHGKIPLL